MNHCLHDLSQPMTVLLCALEYGVGVHSMVEMREMVKVSQQACIRLREITAEMREKVRNAIAERPVNEQVIGLNR